MRRREFITLLGGAASTWLLPGARSKVQFFPKSGCSAWVRPSPPRT